MENMKKIIGQVTVGVVNSFCLMMRKQLTSWVNELVISKFYTSFSVNTFGIQ